MHKIHVLFMSYEELIFANIEDPILKKGFQIGLDFSAVQTVTANCNDYNI